MNLQSPGWCRSDGKYGQRLEACPQAAIVRSMPGTTSTRRACYTTRRVRVRNVWAA
jgi:hypothetical protein